MVAFTFLLAPFACGAVGFVAARLAGILLFRPHRPRRLFGCSLQGILPRRQGAAALAVGELAHSKAPSPEALQELLASEAFQAKGQELIDSALDAALREKLDASPWLAKLFSEATVARLREGLATRIAGYVPAIARAAAREVEARYRIKTVVAEALAAVPPERLEELLLPLVRNDLRRFSLAGGLFGFCLGAAESAILYYF